jgi:aryl-alcohol dehydrogenase-like predicted oxidoreductase
MDSSRRNFLVAGIGLPALASASRSANPEPQAPAKRGSDIKFEYRTLGKTGLKVTSVAFGCMVTSDGSVVERGADLGITYFDTAHSYQQGNNERMVGAALKGKRNSITLSSKTHGLTKQDALNDLDASLKSLQTDHLDIWYLHAKSKPEEVTDDLIDAQQTAKKAGKIRFAGVSTHAGQTVLVPWLAKNPNVDVILSAYNFTLEPGVTTALEQAVAAGKGVAAIKVMAGGFRSLKPGDPAYTKLKQDGGLLAALKWAMRNPKVVNTAVPSITDNDQLEENLTAMQKPYGPAEEKLLAERLELIGGHWPMSVSRRSFFARAGAIATAQGLALKGAAEAAGGSGGDAAGPPHGHCQCRQVFQVFDRRAKVSLIKGDNRRKNIYDALVAIDDQIRPALKARKYVLIKPNGSRPGGN